ncbi:M48 family metallopeptidase [Sphingomonas panacisoli]|uniref:M48 family metallopeptidase n=1 Tax=Sphingomonas panacisoli TaxID=1813879 RepID=A0A5B8LJR0_9SPHN|nr:SprT family zinc-dependent metalloprotease [Sphingomonas panacisoli]QDZ08216.1 M48 family metallopeptidase [Sphingomonas panacisoli]
MINGVVLLGATDIPYTVSYSGRRTLGISVQPSGALTVAAPRGTSLAVIEERLKRRGAWILKSIRDFDRFRPRTPERHYVAGESHRYLGRQYRLLVSPNAARGVVLTRDHIEVGGISTDETSRIRNRLINWYQREARRIMEVRFDACWAKHGSGLRPRLIVRPMEKRWGSLSASGRSLILNRRLVEADVDAIDFVIVHELCHLTYHHHGPAFEALLGARMPDWRDRKARLERWMM